jgi:ribosomal protein S3
MKQHNFFLNFFKRTLILMINSKISCIHGIKVLIKGRFNGKPRSSSKLLQIGKISLQTLDAKISYSQSVAFSQYGTFGIKVWICEK